MATPSNIRWLHLSDFHIGKDDYGQSQLFKYILRHVEKRPKPDFVFITGDIAQSGRAEQYGIFFENFLTPLKTFLGEKCNICIVPGNHDVDRKKEELVTRGAIRQKAPDFFDPDENGQAKRRSIMPRFHAYAEYDQLYLEKDNWLASSDAHFVETTRVKGCRIGILGLNTAWFSEDADDREQLTPGKPIVEKGLEAIAEEDIRIVLGHHPLDWFHPNDERPIRALFGKYQVIYLHGHLHKNSSRFEEGAGYRFLNIQSGAAFQTREDDVWVNGLLWAEWNPTQKCLELEPYCWNTTHQEWSPDTQALPNAYRIAETTRFSLPLDGLQILKADSIDTPNKEAKTHFKVPEGWDLLTRESLKKFNTNPDDAEILSYFDGRIPDFGLALCPKIPRRAIVQKIADRLKAVTQTGHPTINMILGAGGEGKTTAFLQIIEAVLHNGEHWQVVYRRGDRAGLSKKMVDELPRDGHHWLIASDDADLIAEDVHRIAFGLQNEGRDDVHFLLSARHTDWRNTRVTPTQWARMSNYHEEELRGLDSEDAVRIVDAWSAYDEKGLGRLAGLPREAAVKKLVAESRLETSQDEGAFLGALLRLRFGDQLRAHVKKLLDRLNELPIEQGSSKTLLEAFAYIAAMHAENRLFLSKDVLAGVLNIASLGALRSKVLYPLGKEAAADVTPEMVFTRHRAIAEAAVSILSTDTYYQVELDELYVDLVETAERLCQSGNYVTNLPGWRYLSDYFYKENNTALAIRLAQALHRENRTDPYLCVKLAHLFRKAGQPDQALRIFREAPLTELRGFFHEWATAEGNEGNHALTIWLEAVALADDTSREPSDNKRGAMSLAGLGLACRRLFEGYNKPVFIEGCGAASQLGLCLRSLNAKDKKYFSENQQTARSHGVEEVHPAAALLRIQQAVLAAFQQREADLPEWIPPAGELTFEGLEQLVNYNNVAQES